MPPLRIAFAMINCNRRDGSARAVNEVAERLARRGHDVHLFARTAEDFDLALVRWRRVPGPGWPEVVDFGSFYLTTNALLRRNDFDVVHSIGPNTHRANVVTIQNIQPAKKKVLDRHARNERISPLRRLTRAMYLRATAAAERRLYTATETHRPPLFLPVSRGVEAELRAHYEIGSAPVRIVPNAADTTIFRPLDAVQRRAWRHEHGYSDDHVVCLFSGGEWSRKGLALAIRAVAQMPSPRVRLFVAGDDPDRASFHAVAAECGAADRTTFGGFRKDIATAMASADLFLFPSHYEAFSLATIEAAACGLPILATRINGTEDFIEPGINGDFVPADPAGIANVLARWVDDPALRHRAGEAARTLVEQHYTWDHVTDATEAAYREASEGNAGAFRR